MHGGGGVVVGSVDAGDVEVGEVVPEDGIGVGEGEGGHVRAYEREGFEYDCESKLGIAA